MLYLSLARSIVTSYNLPPMTSGPLAHQVEHHTFNVVVPRSSRGRLTNFAGFAGLPSDPIV